MSFAIADDHCAECGHPLGGHNAGCSTSIRERNAEIKRLRKPWRAVDDQDWQYIASVIPDGGRGRFWKSVLAEMRVALSDR